MKVESEAKVSFGMTFHGLQRLQHSKVNKARKQSSQPSKEHYEYYTQSIGTEHVYEFNVRAADYSTITMPVATLDSGLAAFSIFSPFLIPTLKGCLEEWEQIVPHSLII